MNPAARYLIAVLAAVLLAPTAYAAPLYSQDFDASLTSANAASDFDLDFQRADDFNLASDAHLGTIEWLGIYISNDSPLTDNFTLRVFADNGSGLPETTASMLDLNVGNAVNRTDTGVDLGSSVDIYSYRVTLNSGPSLSAGTTYWLSVVNNTDNDDNDNWSWAASSTSNASAFRSLDTDAWSSSSGTVQFALASAPLPGALWLLGSGLLALFSLRKKQGRP